MRALFAFLLFTTVSLGLCAKSPKVIAHRGFWQTEGSAQNSLAALNKAAEIGCYGSEFDVWLTADDVLIVNHDADIDSVHIESSPASVVTACLLSNGETVPTLESYLAEAVKYPELRLILELKPHTDLNREDLAAKMIVEALDRYGLRSRTDIISFSINACLAFKKIDSDMPIYYLMGDLAPRSIKNLGFAGIDYSMGTMRKHPEWYDQSRDNDVEVNVWTINNEEQMREFIDAGADYITTNAPERLIEMLASEPQ